MAERTAQWQRYGGIIMVDCSTVEQDAVSPQEGPSRLTGEIVMRLRDLRQQRRMSARELAEGCAQAGAPSLTRSTIAKIESGVREFITLDELAALAEVLGVSLFQLLQPHSAVRNRHVVWSRDIPFRNRHFIGRERELAELRAGLVADSSVLISQPAQAVFGLGGVGKTELAAEYAHRYRDDYDIVWWMRAERQETIETGFIALGQRLGLPGIRYDERDYSMSVVTDALVAGEPSNRWLLIFDDAKDVAAIGKYIPQTRGHGHVIITSRDTRWEARRAQGIELMVFSSDEAVQFLRRRIPALGSVDADDDGHQAENERRRALAANLAAELGNLPLALEHAAAYLRETGVSVEEYLMMYRDNAHSLLTDDVDTAYPRLVASTWSISTQRISREADAIFQLLAFFAPEPIAEELLRQPVTSESAQLVGDVLHDLEKLRMAIRELSRYSLIKLDNVRNVVQMHRVVQSVTRDRLEREDTVRADKLRETVHLLLAASDPRSPDREESEPVYERSRAHLVSSGAMASPHPAVRELVINQVRQMHRNGRYAESLALGEATLALWQDKFGPDDKLTLRLAIEIGMAMRSSGRTDEARQLNSRTLERLERNYGPADETYLICGRSCSRDLSMLGRNEEALDSDLRLLPLYEQQLGSEHSDTLQLRNNIAVSLCCLGRFEEALAYDREILEVRSRTLGSTDERTLTSQFAVARDLGRLGQYEESLDIVRQVNASLGHRKRPWNLFRLLVGTELSLSLRQVGQYEEALRQGEFTLELHYELVGRDHHRSLLTETYLINDRRLTGDLDGASELGERNLLAWEKAAGPDHPNTNAARANLAIVLRAQNRLASARKLDERALAGFTALHGQDHPNTLVVMTNLASDLAAVGDVRRSREIGETAFAASRRVRGESHPSTLITAVNLSLDLRAVGDETGARELREATLPAMECILGHLHPQVKLGSTWTSIL
jgi:transcriptional regulator with XRE-family HTH domain/tetratricopeptide (TPR) repeat protein